MSQITIVPVNAIDASFLTRLGSCLEERFLFECVVERSLRIARTTLNSVRKQLFLNTLVSRVAASYPDGDGVRLAITDFDLYKTSHQFVFGDANDENRIAAVSRHRLRGDLYGEPADDNLLFQRTLKEAVHDIGHALGLKHCYNPRCAMHFSNSIYDTDNKMSHFCETCEKRLHAKQGNV